VAVTPLQRTGPPASPTESMSRMDAASVRGRQLRGVGWFVGIVLVVAAIAVPIGIAPAAVPFVLALPPAGIAIVLAWREGRGALGRLLRSATIRPARRRWYLVLAIPVAWAFGTVAIAVVLGQPTAGLFDRVFPAVLIIPLVVLLPALTEELAWRGYVLPRLLEVMSPLRASLLLAVPWTLIHVPLFLPGQFNGTVALWAMPVSIFAYSIVLTWIFVRTGGSVLMTTLVHAGLNGVAPIMGGVEPESSWAIRNLLAAGIAIAIVALGGFRGTMAPRRRP
jgi:uncharacterized protein